MDLRQWWLSYKDRLTPNKTTGTAKQTRYWLDKTSLDALQRPAQAREWLSKRPNLVIALVVIAGVLFLLRSAQYAAAATVVGAWFLLAHNIAQRATDFRRRINETYSKAVSQLASDKLEERLGGIYTLENISKESPNDYWMVMETLMAFVRERSQRSYAEFKKSDERISLTAYALWEKQGKLEGKHDENWAKAIQLGEPPATDIAAVLEVIKRRGKRSRERERTNGWHLNLNQAVLKQADLTETHLEGATLIGAHLEGASLMWAHLEGAGFMGAHLEGANFQDAHLEGAGLWNAHLEGATLIGAHLEGASLMWAHLEGAGFMGAHLEEAGLHDAHLEGTNFQAAHLEGADLESALGLSRDQLDYTTHGDAVTKLPAGMERPAHWLLDRACDKLAALPEGLKLDKACPPPEARPPQPVPPNRGHLREGAESYAKRMATCIRRSG